MNTTLRLSVTSLLTNFGIALEPAARRLPLPTVPKVDLQRYSGKWYEIARLPNRFQKADERATAEYTPPADGQILVRNTAISKYGRTRMATGKATVVEGSGGARLRVRFGGLASLAPVSEEGNYWIIALDDEYRSAMVGTPDRKYLWILAREEFLDAGTMESLLEKARSLDFATEKMDWDM